MEYLLSLRQMRRRFILKLLSENHCHCLSNIIAKASCVRCTLPVFQTQKVEAFSELGSGTQASCTEFCINCFCENILILHNRNCCSFSGKAIDHVGIKIEPGFSLKGLINILGFKLRCHIVINFKKEIMIDVSFSPIKIAKGLIAMQKSKKDEENGPKLYAKISAENVDVKLLGYISLLGISAEVAIDISDDYIKFYTYGNLFNLFAANMTVQAGYKKIEEADFVVSDAFFKVWKQLFGNT